MAWIGVAIVGGAVVGGTAMAMGSRSGGSQPTYQNTTYNESTREALNAQIDLAPQLYGAESNDNYGRPAYARLNQKIIEEGLLGEEVVVDSGGYVDRFMAGQLPEGGMEFKSERDVWEQYLKDNPDVARVISSGRDPDGSRAYWTQGKEAWQAAKQHYGTHGVKEGRKKYDIGMYDASGNKVTGTTVKEYVGGEAGPQRQGGAVSLLAGDQKQEFFDGKVRKAGFDEAGNFMGTSKLEQDMLERAKYQQAQTEVGLVGRFGNQLTESYRDQGDIRGALNQYKALGDKTSDHGGLRSSLVGMAKDELALGGQLTDRERRRVEQASRSASSARGRGRDFSAVMDEVVANDQLSRQRENERRLFASQVLGLADSGLQQDRAFAAQRVGLEQATSADPFMALTGRASGASVASGQSLYGNAAAGISAGPTLYNPHAGAEFIANQNAGLNNFNANIYAANAQKDAAMFGSIMSLGGTLGSAAISACWVAREVYGVNNPKWMIFRHWMLFLSPFWFRSIYLTFGEMFAKFIRNKPRLKARIRAWMDTKIRETI